MTITITGLPLQGTVLDTTLLPVETAGVTGHIAASSIKNYLSTSTLTSINAGTGNFTGIVQAGSLYVNDIQASSVVTTGDVTVGGNIIWSSGATTPVSISNIIVTNATVSSNIYMTGTGFITPASNSTVALGTSTNWFNNAYIASATMGSIATGGIVGTGSNLVANIGSTTNWISNVYASKGTFLTATVNTGGLQPGANTMANIGSTSAWFNNIYAVTANYNNIVVNNGGIRPGANLIADIGSSTNWFNNIYGVASHALYADLAEKYTSDSQYASGTVVIFGDDTEVTASTKANDTRVAGVVSTNPAYLMNGGLAGGVAVALQGRVPCKVTGTVIRGDLMVTSDIPGVAMTNNDPKSGTIIGKALGAHIGTGVGIIEVVVGRV